MTVLDLVNSAIVRGASNCERGERAFAASVVVEDQLSAVTTIHHVIDRTRIHLTETMLD